MSYWSTTALAVVIGVVCTLPPHPNVQEAEDLRAKAQNPVASMISLSLENNIASVKDLGKGSREPVGPGS